MLKVTWPQALAWRLKRQLLEPIGTLAVEDVVRRLSGVQAQVASSAELAIRLRREQSTAGEVAQALADGRLVKTWAIRGALHLLTPEDGGAVLALLSENRSWERPSWTSYFGMTPALMGGLRDAAREALDGAVLTREELIEAVTRRPELGHIAQQLRSGWGTLLKPLAFQGDLVYGPSRGTRVTFTRPESASSRWTGLPPAAEAGPRVVTAYLATYGPATMANFVRWSSLGTPRKLRAWFAGTAEPLTQVEVDGELNYIRQADVDGLAAAKPSRAVRLHGGFDQWVLGPGTADSHVIPPGRRTAVSKQAGWIAPIVTVGGMVSGTWELKGDVVSVACFKESGKPPAAGLAAEVERLGAILGRDLRPSVVVLP